MNSLLEEIHLCESLLKEAQEAIDLKSLISQVREIHSNGENDKHCIKATEWLLPYIKQQFPDAYRYDFVLADDDNLNVGTSQHAIILADNNSVVIDSQLEQFQKLLELPEEIVQAGVYDSEIYWSWIPHIRRFRN